jgi:hypothetical protein
MPLATIQTMEPFVFLDPDYQRQGDVWSREKQRLLIDSLANGFIVPPMYWHELTPEDKYFTSSQKYAIVDGRQRLETLFLFLRGDLKLADDFSLLADPDLDLKKCSINDIAERAPWVYSALMRTELDIVVVRTHDIELIEELFSRLNEGVPLSAAEKRNRGPIIPPLVRNLQESHIFFQDRLPFENRRYRHYDLIAKFMRIEDRGLPNGRVPDLRKADLDRLFERFRREDEKIPLAELEAKARDLIDGIIERLDRLSAAFTHHDPFLGSVGMVTLYYVVTAFLARRGLDPLSRDEILQFDELRRSVKGREEDDLSADERLLAEFATYAQGLTSGSYLTSRMHIMLKILRGITFEDVEET